MVPLDQLVPYANNARTHSAAQIDKIAASIREFGFTNPVLTGAKHRILAGHGRVLAARKLGMDAVPVKDLSHLSAAQQRAYVIADNRLALDAGWDEALLSLELEELREGGFDLALTGFDVGELDTLLGGPDDLPGPEPETRASPQGVICPKCGHGFRL
jgi:ParB-like chromosome segregation protein Spo0J